METKTLEIPLADDPQRRAALAATGAVAGAAALAAGTPFVASLGPSERARAAGAPVEVDIGDLAPGAMKIVEWRGKPVWIVRRTPEMIAALSLRDTSLVDPGSAREQQPPYAKNPTRSIRPDIFIAVGVCTHLGCSPTAVPAEAANPSVGADWKGGYFCPCHGSTFDGAGRVFKNKPAPTNLEIPPHRFVDAGRIVIGEDTLA